MLMLNRTDRTRPRGSSLTLDLYSREALLNPHETYRRIREAGAAVWLPRHRMWAMGRYREIRKALRDDETFRSGKGVAANRLTNVLLEGTTLASDGQTHSNRRRVLLQSLSAKALAAVDPILQEEASALTLSKLEMHALLRAMIPAVSQISVSEPAPLLNNTLQGFASFSAAFRN